MFLLDDIFLPSGSLSWIPLWLQILSTPLFGLFIIYSDFSSSGSLSSSWSSLTTWPRLSPLEVLHCPSLRFLCLSSLLCSSYLYPRSPELWSVNPSVTTVDVFFEPHPPPFLFPCRCGVVTSTYPFYSFCPLTTPHPPRPSESNSYFTFSNLFSTI